MMHKPADWVPFLWPKGWRDGSKAELFRSTPYNCAVGDDIPPAAIDALHAQSIDTVSLKSALVTIVRDARWPGIQTQGSDGAAASGPTGSPWVNSNGYAIDAARSMAPDKPVWLAETPDTKTSLRPEDYCLTVCDAAAYGASWLASPDCDAWQQIVAAQKFFENHREWRSFQPQGRLAIVSRFSGRNRFTALETINLLTRRGVAYEIVPPDRTSKFPVVLNLDEEKPNADPWELAARTQEKLGRRNDLYRLWNGTSLNARLTASADGGTALLQLLNFAAHPPSQEVTAGLMTNYRSAKIYTLEHPTGSPIELHRAKEGVEAYLPRFAVYAAIELTR